MSATKAVDRGLNREDRIESLKKRIIAGLPKVCVARAKLMTESYRQTEGEPTPVRRARALAYILENLPISISEGELIVGDYTEAGGIRGAPILPEYSVDWLETEMDTFRTRDGDKFDLSDEDKKTLLDLIPYWKGHTVKEASTFLMPEDLRARYLEYFDVCNNELGRGGQGMSHIVVDYARVIDEGLDSITEEARLNLKEADPSDPFDLDRIHFYRAVIITHKAISDFAARYSRLAHEMAQKETRSWRKEELRKIAEICERVPARPARTFYEALQSFWFIQIAMLNEAHGYAIAPGRMDQYVFPYYQRDMEVGLLNREKAKELLQCLYVKFNSIALILPAAVTKFFAGFPVVEALMLGGVGQDGRDATNDLSYLMLEADGELCMQQPECVIRVHKDIPRDFLLQACEVAKKCRGKLKFINDPVAIAKLLNQGYTVEDARNYGLIGCHEPFVPGKSYFIPGAHINLAMCLELALNNGATLQNGRQLGLKTGNPADFKSMADILEAYRTQVGYFTEHVARYLNVIIEAHARVAPTPFQSSLVEGCLEEGLDLTRGGALYNAGWLSGVGVVNVGDALAGIRKVVFDDCKVTLPELVEILKNNFNGREDIRKALAAAPKFGNDEDYVDLLTKDAVSIFCDEWQSTLYQGGLRQPLAALNANTSGIPLGRAVGASADGRKSGEPLADGGLSPAHGRNVRGPVATCKSVAKIDHVQMKCGSVLNLRFNPDALASEAAMKKFADLMLTYCELGGYHIQFNIVSSETLRDAQQHPEKYRDLLVRVSTWTAYFVELGKDVQEDIIRRIEISEI